MHGRTRRTTTYAGWGVLALALLACSPDRPPQVDVLAPASTTDTTGPYEVVAVIRDEGEPVRAELYWRSADLAPARPIKLVRDGDSDRWRAGIPGRPTGSIIYFRLEIEDDEGHVVRLPAWSGDAPAEYELTVGP